MRPRYTLAVNKQSMDIANQIRPLSNVDVLHRVIR